MFPEVGFRLRILCWVTISVAYFKAMLLTKMIINALADRRVCLKHHTFLSDTFNVKSCFDLFEMFFEVK